MAELPHAATAVVSPDAVKLSLTLEGPTGAAALPSVAVAAVCPAAVKSPLNLEGPPGAAALPPAAAAAVSPVAGPSIPKPSAAPAAKSPGQGGGKVARQSSIMALQVDNTGCLLLKFITFRYMKLTTFVTANCSK